MISTTAEGARPLRVAFLGQAVGRRADGLTSYSEQVVGGLRRRGAEVYFHHARGDGSQVPVDPAHAVAWPTLRFKTVTLPWPGFRPRMQGWLAAQRPDVTHCSLSFTLDDGWVAAAAERAGSARVATFHLPFGQAGTRRALVMRELHRFWARRLGHYQRVIVFTEEHRRRLAEVGVDLGRIEVLPNAVDTGRFCPGPSRVRAERLAGSSLVVGFAGRLDPEKGVRELLAGFVRARLGPDARLLLAGRGALESQVRQLAERDRRVVYLGQLTQLEDRIDFWRAVDIFCLPSSAEGLSISLLEAMASGCAVAVTPAGGLPVVAGGGVELDPSRLADAVAEQLQATSPGRARELGASAREEAVRHHGVDGMLDRLLAIYGSCMNEQDHPGEWTPS
ncbi:MAG TPA: glycosyltransferase family 4 protein [Candidatus Nanopelagicaceae bacterium]|nr:glycosyltransferase family 4 protein [Candidatus Nanopelagicaceae bacterium]